MRREEQNTINEECKREFYNAYDEIKGDSPRRRLLTCSAEVIETEHYYILRSYKTLIACINKATDTCYDLLRIVYGYTPTSAKHISKFAASKAYGGYGSGIYGCAHRVTAR